MVDLGLTVSWRLGPYRIQVYTRRKVLRWLRSSFSSFSSVGQWQEIAASEQDLRLYGLTWKVEGYGGRNIELEL